MENQIRISLLPLQIAWASASKRPRLVIASGHLAARRARALGINFFSWRLLSRERLGAEILGAGLESCS